MTNLLEVREKRVPSPSRVSELLPCVVVARRAPGKEHTVDCRASAYDSASIDGASAAIKPWLGDAFIIALVFGRHGKSRDRCSILLPVAVKLSGKAAEVDIKLCNGVQNIHISIFDHQHGGCTRCWLAMAATEP